MKMPLKNKKKMHPRNIFRSPPDYTDLAIKYKEFRQVCKLQLNGKISIDYKNEVALRLLTQTLLQECYQLKLEFAPGSLVPTLPLRLNYILWLEDLVNCLKVDQVRGIDIGCGSSCIFSVLAARKNSWHMLALESNATNLEYANDNVRRNSLQEFVQIYEQTDRNAIFANYFAAEPTTDSPTFHFCVCNPPFYDSTMPLTAKTRNPGKRHEPRNCPTGHGEELACDGGEVAFVQRIIDESLLFPQRITIFTSMLGHKSSVAKITESLCNKNIKNFTTTEFCQGHTTRWGIAWSFSNRLNLLQLNDVSE